MGITAVSSADVGVAINTYLPRWAADWVYQRCALVQGQRVEVQRVRRQHDSRTNNIEVLIKEYAQGATFEATALRWQAGMVHDKMLSAVQRGDLARVPSLKVIRRVIYKLAAGE